MEDGKKPFYLFSDSSSDFVLTLPLGLLSICLVLLFDLVCNDGHASLLPGGVPGLWLDIIVGGVPCDSGDDDVVTVSGDVSFFLRN